LQFQENLIPILALAAAKTKVEELVPKVKDGNLSYRERATHIDALNKALKAMIEAFKSINGITFGDTFSGPAIADL